MRRLNVREAQINECIKSAMFAIDFQPQTPELQPGELLLLQLVKQDAVKREKLNSRIDFALKFDRLERDYDGSISRKHWPNEGRIWNWIIYCSATIPTIPFSLENLNLSRSYDGQDNARYIAPEDERQIMQFIQWSLAENPELEKQIVPNIELSKQFGQESTLSAIFNHDRIALLRPRSRKVVSVNRPYRNRALADSLKSYYNYHCQICNYNFQSRYGVQVADTHHIHYLSNGGPDISGNIIVVCPNHHSIIHATNARFDRENLIYEYPNGLWEELVLTDHLTQASSLYDVYEVSAA
ncbi:MAG TPA: HNH endonuclease [Pyrinomonadaceae bacterium]|nr:HNH endonuclease [Pyrinomonadaceae bacterium]